MQDTAVLVGLGGVLLLGITTTIWFLRAKRVAIPDSRLVFLLGWAGSGLLGAASFVSSGVSWVSGVFGGLSLVGSFFFLGLYALRKQRAKNPIMVGDPVPTFVATDDRGGSYHSAALIGTPTLMKFFRGHW